MAQSSKNDIRSTEKLLELIRNQNSADMDAGDSAHPPKTGETRFIPSAFQKRITIGVDIGHTHIKLAKIIRSDKSSELIDYLDVPFNKSVAIKEEAFLKSLKTAVDQFTEGITHYDIWAAIQSAKVETRSIRIPKLPRKQVYNAVFWKFTKKIPFDKNLELLDYEIIGDINEGGVKKTEVLAFKAPKSEIIAFKEAFKKIGYPLKGITIVPFAIQNLFRSQIIPHSKDDTCCFFVGRDWSRIAIYSKGNLVLSRGIRAGMRSMVDAINNTLAAENEWLAEKADDGEKEPYETTPESLAILPKAQELFFKFIGVPLRNRDASSNIQEIDQTKIFQMVMPALERLVRQIERTFEHYALNFSSEGVKNIFISGQIIANPHVINYFEKQLDIPIVPMNPFPANTSFTQQIKIPDTVSDKESFVPAVGLALSRNSITPNFMFTHEDKETSENIRRTNMRILTACMICLIVMASLFSWQQRRLDIKREKVEELNNQLIRYSPPAKKDLILSLYAKAQQKRKMTRKIIHRYAPAAIITEVADITPSNIRLLSIDASFAQKGTKPSTRSVVIEGLIFGDNGSYETMLTSYLLSLKNSPLFRKPSVQSKKVEYYHDQKIMHFITRLEMI